MHGVFKNILKIQVENVSLKYKIKTRSSDAMLCNRVGRCAAELVRIFYFQNGGSPPFWISCFRNFCEKFKFAPISSLSCKIWCRSKYPRMSYCVFSIFKMAAVRHLGFGMTSYRTTRNLCLMVLTYPPKIAHSSC